MLAYTYLELEVAPTTSPPAETATTPGGVDAGVPLRDELVGRGWEVCSEDHDRGHAYLVLRREI